MTSQVKSPVSWDLSGWVIFCGNFKDRSVFILGTLIIWNIRNTPNQRHSVTSQKTAVFNNIPVRTSNAEFQIIKYREIQEESSVLFGGDSIGHCEKKRFILTYRLYFVKKGQRAKHEFSKRSNKNRFLRNFPIYCKQIICSAKILSIW